MGGEFPWMRWYGDLFWSDVDDLDLTDAQIVAYMRLIWHAWAHNGSIPAAASALAKIARVSRPRFERSIWPALQSVWYDDGRGGLTQQRVAAEVADRAGKTGKRSASSDRMRALAQKRWGKRTDAADAGSHAQDDAGAQCGAHAENDAERNAPRNAGRIRRERVQVQKDQEGKEGRKEGCTSGSDRTVPDGTEVPGGRVGEVLAAAPATMRGTRAGGAA